MWAFPGIMGTRWSLRLLTQTILWFCSKNYVLSVNRVWPCNDHFLARKTSKSSSLPCSTKPLDHHFQVCPLTVFKGTFHKSQSFSALFLTLRQNKKFNKVKVYQSLQFVQLVLTPLLCYKRQVGISRPLTDTKQLWWIFTYPKLLPYK